MGLDMYLYQRAGGEDAAVGYWRKFNALHGYIRDRYLPKDADGDNCVEMPLTTNDLRCIVADLQAVAEIFIKANWLDEDYNNIVDDNNEPELSDKDLATIADILPPTTGFFFGSQEVDQSYMGKVVNALQVFKQAYFDSQRGEEFYYYAWY